MAPRGVLTLVAVTVMALSGCGWGGDSDVSATQSEEVRGEMRSVPTVPSNEDDGGADPAADAGEPGVGPPVTEVVGDPQPDPDDPEPLPPLPASPAIDVCSLLVDVGADAVAASAAGVPVELVPIRDQACRLAGPGVVVDVHVVAEADIESDWFRRDGIEPVGEVGGDAVGFDDFVAPGSEVTAGYTIALLERRTGVVVAVQGTGDDRVVAAELAVLVASAI